MRKNILIAVFALLGMTLTANAQTVENDTVKTKADTVVVKKNVTKEETHIGAVAALENRHFVLQAHDMASIKTDAKATIDSSTNFLAIKGDKGVLQIAPPTSQKDTSSQSMLTMKLDLLSYDLQTDRRGNVTCQLSALVNGSPKDFEIKLNRKSNRAKVTYDGSSFVFLGELLPGEVANINLGNYAEG